MARAASYDKQPFVPVGPPSACEVGWPRDPGAPPGPALALAAASSPSSAIPASTWTRSGGRSREGLRPALVVDVRQAYRDAAEIERMCASVPRRRPGFRPDERPRRRRFPRPGPHGGPARADRQPRERASSSWWGREPSLLGEPDVARVRRPRALGDPAEAAAARGREPGRPRPEGSARQALQAGLLRGLAGGRPPEAHAPRADRLAARHERPRGAEDDRGRRLPARPAPPRRGGPSGSCPSSTPARGAGSG